MLEMKMERLLKHPVIVEVLNLIYEGKYSSDGDPLNLSQTLASFFQVSTFDTKSFFDRLKSNITSIIEKK